MAEIVFAGRVVRGHVFGGGGGGGLLGLLLGGSREAG